MIVRCEQCCAAFDDAQVSTICPHYPLGVGPGSFCKWCDLFKPCPCDREARPSADPPPVP